MQNPWVFYTFVKNSWIFIILNFILWQIKNEFPKLMQMHFHFFIFWKCIFIFWKCICKIHGNAFPKFGNAFAKFRNAFAKFMKMHFQKLEIHLQNPWNAFAKFMKMHLQNPWKCICKIHNFFFGFAILQMHFQNPKFKMHFFFPGKYSIKLDLFF